MNQKAYEDLKAATLAAFDAYLKETKGRVLNDKELAMLFREVATVTEELDFNA